MIISYGKTIECDLFIIVERMSSVKSKTKKIILFSSIAVFLCAITAVILIVVNRKTSEDKKAANKKFDENNIGEVYYSPIDETHIATDENGIMYADNEILVVAANGVTKNQIVELAKKYDAEVVGYIEQTGDYQWKLSSGSSANEIKKTINTIKNNSIVSDCYMNYMYENEADTVDESQVITYGAKWSGDLADLNDTNGKSWGAELINAPAAWNFLESHKSDVNPVRIGIVDSGFNENHDDLSFADDGIFYQNGRNDIPNASNNERIYNSTFHGTHVAGTFAAIGTNNIGINGIYPYSEDRLYGVSRSNEVQHTENGVEIQSCMADKIAFSELIFRNIKVINISMNNERARVARIVNRENGWKESLDNLNINSQILGDYFERLIRRGYDFVIVSAAGNGSSDVTGNMESQYNSFINNITNDIVKKRIIVVGSVGQGSTPHNDNNGRLEYYDINGKYNISEFSNAGNRVDIFAPGYKIYSCYSSVGYNSSNKSYFSINNDEQYDYLSGTSMAAPHVAGVCADVWSINNDLSGEQVKNIVINSIIVNSNCPLTEGVNDDNYAEKLKELGYNGIYRYPIVDCNEAVRTAFSTRGLSHNTNKDYGVALGWVVERDKNDPPADSNSTRIADVTLEVYTNSAEHKRITVDGVSEWKTDKYGHFEILLLEGDYLIEAHKNGYTSKTGNYSVAVKIKPQEIAYTKWIELFPDDGSSNENNQGTPEKNDKDNNDDSSSIINEKKKYLDEIPIINSDQYNDNEGDSFVYPIGKHKFSRGRTDISGKEYEHGIEVWIARWNYTEEKSWAYSVFKLNKDYKNVSGKCVLINSYNTNHFDTTLEFYGDGKLIKQYRLTPDSIPFDIDIDVNNVDELKIYAYDNKAVSGGTSFGLTDMKLDSTNDKGSDNKTKDVENLASKAASENGKKYWIVFHEGYRDGRLEMTSFNAENGFKVVWNKNLVCDRQTGQCAQFAFDTNKSAFVKIGDYNIITDYAIDVVYSNVDIYDTNGNIVFKATHKSNNKELDVKTATDEQLYKEILDQYKKDIADGFVFGIGNGSLTANEVGFAFYDLNNDGYKELMIIQGDGKEKRGTIFDLYSTVDSKPKRILGSTFVGSSISIAQDNSIVLYNRFSTNEGWYDKYNSLITLLSSANPNERLDYKPDYNIGMPTYKYIVGGNEKTISGDEFQSIVNKWTNNSKTFSIKLFSEYK